MSGEQLELTEPGREGAGAAQATARMPASTPEQRRAIEARDRDVLLEAGAGTGKTRVLVERYCEAAEDEEGGIDAILAFTFTERAAAELRHRIRGELSRRASEAREEGDGERAARLAELARDSERAWISTIHGFCRRLLAAHPVALGLDPRFRVLDEAEADRLAQRAFDEALEALLGEADPGRAELVAAMRVPDLRDLVRTAHDELRSQGREPVLPEPADSDPTGAIEELAAAARAACEETQGGRGGLQEPRAARSRGRPGSSSASAHRAGARGAEARVSAPGLQGPGMRRATGRPGSAHARPSPSATRRPLPPHRRAAGPVRPPLRAS